MLFSAGCLIWTGAGFALLTQSSLCLPLQQRPPALPLIGSNSGLAHIAFQDLGRLLGAFGLESDSESHIPLRAASLSARNLKLLVAHSPTAPLNEQLQHCPLVPILLLRSTFTLLLWHRVLVRAFRCRGGIHSGLWRTTPLHSLVHQRRTNLFSFFWVSGLNSLLEVIDVTN